MNKNEEEVTMHAVVGLWARLIAAHQGRLAGRDLDAESGQAVNEWLGLSALAIVAIVAIGAAMKLLGLDLVDWIRAQLGV
jgi:hypothetical protein